MDIINTLRINLRKLKTYKQKAIFLIVPIVLLMALSIIVTSETTNFKSAAETSIFGTLTAANQTIELNKNSVNSRFGNLQAAPSGGGGASAGGTFSISAVGSFPSGGGTAQDLFTESDITKLLSIPHVASANMINALPISNIVATDALSTNYTVSSMAGIDAQLASQFTDQDFSYTDGDVIPIIVNSNDFVSRTEEWNGKSSMTIALTRGADPSSEANSPIKTAAISYTKDELMGKEFTMTVGGLTAEQDYKVEPSSSGITFTKLEQSALDSTEQARKDLLSLYWNYDSIKNPVSYKFKIVGVIEDTSNTFTFIPEAAATKLMNNYIQHQLDARTSNTIETKDLDSKFQGLTWDGTELRQSGVSGFGGVGGGTRIRFERGGIDTSTNYTVPGLVIELNRSDNTVVGEFKNADIYKSATKSSSVVLIKIDDAVNRGDVVTALNAAGFAYQDTSKLGVISELKTTLNNIVIGVGVGFVLISIMVIIFTMGKFVSDSKREIGVFRALGATRSEIRFLFISQAVMYVIFGYIVGALIGIGSVLALSSVALAAFNNFVGNTLKQSFAVVNPVGSDAFMHVNWEMFAVFSLALLVITIVTSLIPATSASKVSPVEAIRGE